MANKTSDQKPIQNAKSRFDGGADEGYKSAPQREQNF